ncbi:transposable element Tc3 transposase [Trichonephila clavipes]|nr:transposable element Tc3 transposase [Trichonephila clavipes]
MDVCKCIVRLRHGGTLNSRRALSPLVRLVAGEERWEVSGHLQGFLTLNWGGTEQNRIVTCMELWFQQDGATCHTARATINLLKDTFGDRLISRFGPVNWPPRSCDLTPLDYFLWGYVKSLVYADKPQTLDHLEDNIHRVIADIRPQMLGKVIENWTSGLDYIRASRCSPMPEIIFKIPSAQWSSGSVSSFRTSDPGLYPRTGQDRLSLSSLQWVDK